VIKKILLGGILFAVSFLILEVFLGYLLWVTRAETPSATYSLLRSVYSRLHSKGGKPGRIVTSFSPRSPYVPDPYLGYVDRPGEYNLELRDEGTGRYLRFTITIDKNGNRITSFAPALFENKKAIWIFGDSYTYGWGNNDETTFPFLLQQRLPDFQVVNYADNGYGNVHAYLQLQRELQNGRRPAIIVIVYGDYFNVRNVAAPSRLREFNHNPTPFQSEPLAFSHPRASLDSGKVNVQYVPLFSKSNDGKDPGKDYQQAVTKAIVREIYAMGRKEGASLVLAFIRGDDSDDVVAYCRDLGYAISDIRPDKVRKEWDDFLPFDVHPGPLAQDHYAIKLHGTISRISIPATKRHQ
jgi:hypothetical protein